MKPMEPFSWPYPTKHQIHHFRCWIISSKEHMEGYKLSTSRCEPPPWSLSTVAILLIPKKQKSSDTFQVQCSARISFLQILPTSTVTFLKMSPVSAYFSLFCHAWRCLRQHRIVGDPKEFRPGRYQQPNFQTPSNEINFVLIQNHQYHDATVIVQSGVTAMFFQISRTDSDGDTAVDINFDGSQSMSRTTSTTLVTIELNSLTSSWCSIEFQNELFEK